MAIKKRTRKASPRGAPRRVDVATINPPEIAGISACIEDARAAALDPDRGPAEPTSYKELRDRLEPLRERFPPLYRDNFYKPFVSALDQLGEKGYSGLLARDPAREGQAGLMMDIALALLQRGEKYADVATDAFQEVVSDLYDGFLSKEDRHGVKLPDKSAIAPLVKWGNPDFGPYTWPIDATSSFRVQTGVVNLPPANARSGLVAWPAIAHETAGHDILGADSGLAAELANEIRRALKPLGAGLSHYWASRIDETASDVMGVLNMGPAAAIGLVAYFRALNGAYAGETKLRCTGSEDDPHPADIARGYLAAETVALLDFTGKTKWAKIVSKETDKDLEPIVLGRTEVKVALVRKSARVVAETLVSYKAKRLEGHALGDIQNWRDRDERVVKALRAALRTQTPAPESAMADAYAAHAVAAAVTEALSDGQQIAAVFERMLALLKAMHDANPCWGPLYLRHRGDMARRTLYPRKRATVST